MRAIVRGFLGFLLALAFLPAVHAASTIVRDLPPGLEVPDAAKPGPNFDVDRATDAYLALLTPEQRELSNRYFEGGYWLQLGGVLYGVVVAALLLWSGASQRMRDIGRRVSRRPWLQTLVYAFLWLLVMFVLLLPFSIYEDYWREWQYGLATQTFGPWFVDQLKGLAVTLIVM
ncbi:MAG TPA: hypothetical protein VFV97_13210 [Rhodanobacteraceae bacterium]|nr:hypothetical protein [Rhodanobacteraceae bacterium]